MLLKISKWLETLAFKFRQKSLYFELKHYLKNNQSYFRRIHYWEKRMGKTYTLVKLAKKFKYPIAVPNQSTADYIRRLSRDLKIKDIKIIPCNTSVIGKRFDKILCEEGINEDFIHEVLKPMSKCLIGYVNTDIYSNKQKFQQEYECDWKFEV